MEIRIYYEDTDAAGVVYHANYIKYLERARTEFFRTHGFLVAELAEEGFIFPVIRLEIDFKSPAYHDDLLSIETEPVRVGGASCTLHQSIHRKKDEKLLADGFVTLACTGPDHKARRIPLAMRQFLMSQVVRK